jgi:tetratricopeptide (TPR) repeat protein
MPALRLRSFGRAPRQSGIRAAVSADEKLAIAANALEAGERLLARGRLEQAAERFQVAARAYDELGDAASSARALLGLGRVLLGLEDPVCREVLEDAGTAYEDLGDEAAVREIDGLLRAAERSIDESPRSFHAVAAPRVVDLE